MRLNLHAGHNFPGFRRRILSPPDKGCLERRKYRLMVDCYERRVRRSELSKVGQVAFWRPIGSGSIQLACKTAHFLLYFRRLNGLCAIESSRLLERAIRLQNAQEK